MGKHNPTFSDIVALLNSLVPLTDDDIRSSPHDAFWRSIDRDAFVALTTDDWTVPGKLVTLGKPEASNLYLALAGLKPFDGSGAPQMPDTDSDPTARRAARDELDMVATWIRNDAPK